MEVNKIKLQNSISVDLPKIGIFWLHLKDGKIEIFHSVPVALKNGITYGNFIIADQSHYDAWEILRKNQMVPEKSNYEDLPRGRIAYDTFRQKYIIYHGNYITALPKIKYVIKKNFNLKSNYLWETDLHYMKFARWGF